MQWDEIRRLNPHQWLLVEAVEAHSSAGRRVLDDLAVVQAFEEAKSAMDGYKDLHRQDPRRELYVVHTDRDELDVLESHWLGLRTA